jgi:hypothetical protein
MVGRVELWLEMKLPGQEARAQIFCDYLKNLPQELLSIDAPRLIAATEGFTGADLNERDCADSIPGRVGAAKFLVQLKSALCGVGSSIRWARNKRLWSIWK